MAAERSCGGRKKAQGPRRKSVRAASTGGRMACAPCSASVPGDYKWVAGPRTAPIIVLRPAPDDGEGRACARSHGEVVVA
eukprot:scaffold1093_cov359-Prasinococcus_capsulatus_cf.AAC.2